jgi:hypothetical protein
MSCRDDCIGLMAAVPQIADDLGVDRSRGTQAEARERNSYSTLTMS